MVRQMQQQQYSNCYTSSQEDDFDGDAFVAEIDAILRAPVQPVSVERQFAGVLRTLDRLTVELGLTPLAANDDWKADLDAALDAIDLPAAPPAPIQYPAPHPAWVALFDKNRRARERFAAIRARYSASDEPANDEAVTPPLAPAFVPDLVTSAPKPARRLKRRSGSRQSADARQIRQHARPSSGEPVEDLPSTSTTSKTSTKTKTRTRGIASWEDAGELPQIIAVNRAVAVLGSPFAWSLNIHPDLIQAGNDNVRGLLDFMRRRVARHLNREMGRHMPFWFEIETDDDGRPHLHGGIPMANDNEDAPAIERALVKAGGNWSRRGSAPADVRRQYEPDGWAVYGLKRIGRTRRHLREAAGLDQDEDGKKKHITVWTCTDDLRTEGQRIHEETRRAINQGATSYAYTRRGSHGR